MQTNEGKEKSPNFLLEQNAVWHQRFEALREYKDSHGMPPKHGSELFNWVVSQRRQYARYIAGKPCLMTKEKVAQLHGLGFVLQPTTGRECSATGLWDDNLKELKQFKLIYGHALAPCRRINGKENARLGRWLDQQREQYWLRKSGKQSSLNGPKIKALESIGVVWDFGVASEVASEAELWNNKLEELRRYKLRFGNCQVPLDEGESNPYYSLGRWLAYQVHQYTLRQSGKKSSLTDERKYALESTFDCVAWYAKKGNLQLHDEGEPATDPENACCSEEQTLTDTAVATLLKSSISVSLGLVRVENTKEYSTSIPAGSMPCRLFPKVILGRTDNTCSWASSASNKPRVDLGISNDTIGVSRCQLRVAAESEDHIHLELFPKALPTVRCFHFESRDDGTTKLVMKTPKHAEGAFRLNVGDVVQFDTYMRQDGSGARHKFRLVRMEANSEQQHSLTRSDKQSSSADENAKKDDPQVRENELTSEEDDKHSENSSVKGTYGGNKMLDSSDDLASPASARAGAPASATTAESPEAVVQSASSGTAGKAKTSETKKSAPEAPSEGLTFGSSDTTAGAPANEREKGVSVGSGGVALARGGLPFGSSSTFGGSAKKMEAAEKTKDAKKALASDGGKYGPSPKKFSSGAAAPALPVPKGSSDASDKKASAPPSTAQGGFSVGSAAKAPPVGSTTASAVGSSFSSGGEEKKKEEAKNIAASSAAAPKLVVGATAVAALSTSASAPPTAFSFDPIAPTAKAGAASENKKTSEEEQCVTDEDSGNVRRSGRVRTPPAHFEPPLTPSQIKKRDMLTKTREAAEKATAKKPATVSRATAGKEKKPAAAKTDAAFSTPTSKTSEGQRDAVGEVSSGNGRRSGRARKPPVHFEPPLTPSQIKARDALIRKREAAAVRLDERDGAPAKRTKTKAAAEKSAAKKPASVSKAVTGKTKPAAEKVAAACCTTTEKRPSPNGGAGGGADTHDAPSHGASRAPGRAEENRLLRERVNNGAQMMVYRLSLKEFAFVDEIICIDEESSDSFKIFFFFEDGEEEMIDLYRAERNSFKILDDEP